MKKKYRAVSVLEVLMKKVDEIVINKKYGFSSRSGFVNRAINEELKKYDPLDKTIKRLEEKNEQYRQEIKRLKRRLNKE